MKLRLLLTILAVLFLANLGYRLYTNRGRITVHADDKPLAEVIRSIEKQAGIRLQSSLPLDTKVTLHLRKVPLLHALEVLAATAQADWSIAYFAAPDKPAIDSALAAIARGENPEGWKRWSMPPVRALAEMEGAPSDPRTEQWKVKTPGERNLHAYLGQAATLLSAQFFAPAQWNPAIRSDPKPGQIRKVLPTLAKHAGGRSAEVFLLRGRREFRAVADRTPPREGTGDFSPQFRSEPPSEERRKAMEERETAMIERLPKDKQAEARARAEERRKLFAEMATLSPEERRAKMEERMEQAMSNSDTAARMSTGGTKHGAMQTADQRSDRYRTYLENKRQLNQ